MNGKRFLSIALTAAALLPLAPTRAVAVGIKMLSCSREAADKASNVAQGVCKSQARVAGGNAGAIYIATLGPGEGSDAVAAAAKQQGVCRAGIDVVAGPQPDAAGHNQLAFRCASGAH